MYILNDIVYAGEPEQIPKVVCARPLANHRLFLRFSTGETKIFDVTALLERGVFSQLKDEAVFNSVYLEYSVPTWRDGAIDIDPERLYEDSKIIEIKDARVIGGLL